MTKRKRKAPTPPDDAVRVPEAACPKCGYVMDACTPTARNKGTTPDPGDISLCIKCAALLRFTDSLGLRAMTDAEWDALDDELKLGLHQYRAAIRLMNARNRKAVETEVAAAEQRQDARDAALPPFRR